MSDDVVVPERVDARLLIVDDEPSVLNALARALKRQPYEVVAAPDPQRALEILEPEHIGVVVSDYRMPSMDGVRFLTIVKERWPLVQRIMLTGQADDAALEGVVNESAVFRFLAKPWDHKSLVLTISESFAQYRILLENERLGELSRRQNDKLMSLNRSLEAKVHRRTEQLHRAKLEWERTFDAIVNPVAIVDEKYEVLRANVAYAEHSGCLIVDVPGRKCHELVANRDEPCEGCPMQGVLQDGSKATGVDIPASGGRTLNVWTFPVPLNEPAHRSSSLAAPPATSRSPAPDTIEFTGPVTVDLNRRTVVCHYRDVTEERRLEAELARTERLASLGLFVGGVAHEINNPLGGVLAFTQLLIKGVVDADEAPEVLKDIEASALRCKRIIDSLQSFAHGSAHLNQETIDVGALVKDVVTFFRRDYVVADAIQVDIEIVGGAPVVRGDAALLHQLLRNLLVNGLHALGGEAGRLSLLVSSNDGHVVIEVSDTGTGIAEERLARIFDPFFTTKGEKEGTGLGLSICHRIVEQHDGQIEVKSKLGEGTTFKVRIPAIDAGRSEIQ